jgi:hypothetical protein
MLKNGQSLENEILKNGLKDVGNERETESSVRK